MTAATQLHGIGEYVQRLEKVAQECGEKKDQQECEKDEFLRVKQRLYVLLDETRQHIHDRSAVLRRRGNCHETIIKGHTVRQNLDEMRKCLPKLQELHKKAQSKRGAAKNREELQARYKDIRVLKRHVDEVAELFAAHSAGAETQSENPSVSLLGVRHLTTARPEDCKRMLTADEEEALATMKRRDAELDKQVAEVGLVLERLDPLARQIGTTAEAQRLKAEALGYDVEKADKDLKVMNSKIEDVIKYERNTNCCCQMVLLIVLLCCLGFVFQLLKL